MTEVHLRLGRFHSALRILRRGQEQAISVPGTFIAQMLAYNLAETQLGFMEPQAAVVTLVTAMPAVRKSGLSELLIRFHARLALAYATVGDPSQAEVHERLALDALSPDAEVDARLDALLDLGEASLLALRLDDAERRLHDVAESAQAADRPWSQARALRLLAACDDRRGQWDRAEARLETAAALCRTAGFRSELAKCYKSLGSIHWEVGLRARAEEDFERSVRLLEELDLRTELGLTYLARARLVAARSG
jgi:tetratricopeptide (TPR) repeat protein